jgi:hypothetical protein
MGVRILQPSQLDCLEEGIKYKIISNWGNSHTWWIEFLTNINSCCNYEGTNESMPRILHPIVSNLFVCVHLERQSSHSCLLLSFYLLQWDHRWMNRKSCWRLKSTLKMSVRIAVAAVNVLNLPFDIIFYSNLPFHFLLPLLTLNGLMKS